MNNIKEMKLYSNAYRIFNDLKALGYAEEDKLKLEDVNQFDQLHYHGTLSCLLYTSPSPRDRLLSRMPSSA